MRQINCKSVEEQTKFFFLFVNKLKIVKNVVAGGGTQLVIQKSHFKGNCGSKFLGYG